ncbi:hypothetical protein PMIT1313_00815 [Prochlorococcus marinus str. MIT 1313]|uniref:lactate dehydrogenase n=1 Tax=Prochlorococcus TaxID=1218 RepID=UPI0007BB2FC2|nr:hypothetical protein PMIT1313_00815 [Prochlorococcus marinus str. MIT 1313]KZR72887.1 hypothetical protein PMIT1318_00854 [Prochlorococcus marinus str. MIT 1318]
MQAAAEAHAFLWGSSTMGEVHVSLMFRCAAFGLLTLLLCSGSTGAQVRFDDCEPSAAGGVTCNTVPEGNTRMQMIDGESGLLDDASPGWSEYDPYEGYEDMLDDNQT